MVIMNVPKKIDTFCTVKTHTSMNQIKTRSGGNHYTTTYAPNSIRTVVTLPYYNGFRLIYFLFIY